MKPLLKITAIVCCLAACATAKTPELKVAKSQQKAVKAQQKTAEKQRKSAQILDSLHNRTYTIAFDYVIPSKMQPRFLTSDYSVRVHGDSIVSSLPYFGVAYRADPENRNRSPLDFKSAISSYETDQVKKNKMRVKLKTRNKMDFLSYYLDIFTNGSVTLNVIATDRESVSFTGNLILND